MCVFFSVPSVAPPSVEAHALNAHQIVVTWKPIPQHSTNGLLKGYTVQYTDTKTPSVRKEIVVNGLLQALLTGLKAHTRYLIQVSGYTNTGPGVVSTAKFTVTDEARELIFLFLISFRTFKNSSSITYGVRIINITCMNYNTAHRILHQFILFPWKPCIFLTLYL